jgi:hypothetical protein
MWANTQDTLALIEHYESGGRNVMNYINDAWHTAGGYWQITNTTWRYAAPGAGVDLTQYPIAISAPREVQHSVAIALFDRFGVLPWAPFNPRLAEAVGYSGEMYDEVGRTVSGDPLYRQPSFYGRAAPLVRRHDADDEVWD